MYNVHYFDNFAETNARSRSLFSLCWTGVDNFYDGLEDMIGYRPNPWMKWSWTIITPVLCMVRDQRQLSGASLYCIGVTDM